MSILLDSSVYIAAMRTGDTAGLTSARWASGEPLWLSSVVLEELYAGASATEDRMHKRLEHDFEAIRRILVPNLSDWTKAGKLLGNIGSKYGYERIGRARMTNDALIATSAARLGITVVTANQRDFAKLAEFCHLKWRTETIA